ncbi:hypothetical protein COY43_02280 [Candidatus Berkelbacteria bacterium CG_4_10_14_0_8_um_filter_35_9_33_8]|nr:MAG: hypothetical protein COY43_02280 [Candidatus Berkelbacteria bacterium CG_4_10_14_0_8_um_filter_35_9_33_8]
MAPKGAIGWRETFFVSKNNKKVIMPLDPNYIKNRLKEIENQNTQATTHQSALAQAINEQNKSTVSDHSNLIFFCIVLAVIIIYIITKKFMFKNISPNKKIEILVISVYTILNLYVIGDFIFSPYWQATILGKETNFVFFGVIIGLFLNAALIIYSIHKNKI